MQHNIKNKNNNNTFNSNYHNSSSNLKNKHMHQSKSNTCNITGDNLPFEAIYDEQKLKCNDDSSNIGPSFIVSKYGTKQIMFKQHTFNRHISREDVTYWRCSQFAVLRCRSRLKTKGDTLTILNSEHNHEVITKARKYGSLKKLKAEAAAAAATKTCNISISSSNSSSNADEKANVPANAVSLI